MRRERDRARRAAQSEEQRASVLLRKRKGLKKMAILRAIVIRVVIRGRAGWAVTNGRRTGGCLAHNSPHVMGNVFAVFAPSGQYLAELWLLHHVHLTDKYPPYHLATAPASCCLIRLICVTWVLVHETNASLHCHGTFSGSPHNALHSLIIY